MHTKRSKESDSQQLLSYNSSKSESNKVQELQLSKHSPYNDRMKTNSDFSPLSSNDQNKTKLRTNAPEENHHGEDKGAPVSLGSREVEGPAAMSSTASFSSVEHAEETQSLAPAEEL